VKHFPFDKQVCQAKTELRWKNNFTVTLSADNPPFIYNGQMILPEFEIKKITANASITKSGSTFILYIHLDRLYLVQLSTTFFQTLLLWFLAYLTFFIDSSDFSNRFMGSLTALLVLAAFLSTFNASIPKSAGFKDIDMWFLFFLFNIFLVIIVHVIIDVLMRSSIPKKAEKKAKTHAWVGMDIKHGQRCNRISQFMFLIITIIFIGLYFMYSTKS
jgi:hypothetical protein